jgi:hypothetical protein
VVDLANYEAKQFEKVTLQLECQDTRSNRVAQLESQFKITISFNGKEHVALQSVRSQWIFFSFEHPMRSEEFALISVMAASYFLNS